MFHRLKNLILELVPRSWLSAYHLGLAHLGSLAYGRPSRKLVVIGVTGTSGKSTTAFILHNLLQGAGYKVGSLSTIAFRVGDWFQLNDRKMTMLGRFQTQKFLARMVKAGCQYAIVETTSQGIEQFLHGNRLEGARRKIMRRIVGGFGDVAGALDGREHGFDRHHRHTESAGEGLERPGPRCRQV